MATQQELPPLGPIADYKKNIVVRIEASCEEWRRPKEAERLLSNVSHYA